MISRRKFIGWLATISALPVLATAENNRAKEKMYGIIGKMIAIHGKRDELASILISGVSGMPGCLSYIVSNDMKDENALWITEVWESKEDHTASLSLVSVKEAISKGRPLIAGFGERFETVPVGGHGL